MEEADKEKAIKQVAKSSFNEKILELNVAKRRATTGKRARELDEQKVEDLHGKLGEAKVKLAKVLSTVSTRDKELANLKETMKNYKQVFYNTGFKEAKNSAGAIVF